MKTRGSKTEAIKEDWESIIDNWKPPSHKCLAAMGAFIKEFVLKNRRPANLREIYEFLLPGQTPHKGGFTYYLRAGVLVHTKVRGYYLPGPNA